ncbi:MAG: SIR2 family protein [Methanosarcina sp.]|mgnify:CR=1 FL=1|jgi:hypothetical protein|nr:SIR2 family protein [Methanosarcina sp.]MDD3317262.1 SIR2 family protein [Methanosarcina sp.]MDD4306265.1 SIR2 family protein [Methanosarcina sp.]MDD4619523.1 SIR2 family protein [Methanosarcina sp.]NLN43646.1 hypothetical protein [Methanosarcina sp.]
MNIQSSEYVLLLGAGFTKNFGAPLASEMWDLIAGHEIIQTQPRIKKLMQYDDSDHSYESIYYTVLEEGFEDKNGLFGEIDKNVRFTNEEQKAIEEAINFAYEHIDETLIKYIEEQGHKSVLINISHFISSFLRGEIFMTSDGYILTTSDGYIFMTAPDNNKKAFIFSLNQDLFFERAFSKYDNIKLYRPGIKSEPNWVRNGINEKLADSDLCELPNENELNDEGILPKGSRLIIKLHGSYDWIRFDGSRRAMVIGRDKETQIQKEPLLSCYFDIFKETLSQGQRRLLIVGYGFGDPHINRVLSKAVTCHGLKIYILSPKSPKEFKEELFERLKKSEDTINIYNGILGYFQVEDILLKEVDGNKVRTEFDNIFFLDILEDNNWKC